MVFVPQVPMASGPVLPVMVALPDSVAPHMVMAAAPVALNDPLMVPPVMYRAPPGWMITPLVMTAPAATQTNWPLPMTSGPMYFPVMQAVGGTTSIAAVAVT